MTLRRWYWAQFWLCVFGGGCAVAGFVGCVLQARPGVAIVNVASFGLNALLVREAWRFTHPRAAAPRSGT